jgi:hypothetical protein
VCFSSASGETASFSRAAVRSLSGLGLNRCNPYRVASQDAKAGKGATDGLLRAQLHDGGVHRKGTAGVGLCTRWYTQPAYVRDTRLAKQHHLPFSVTHNTFVAFLRCVRWLLLPPLLSRRSAVASACGVCYTLAAGPFPK